MALRPEQAAGSLAQGELPICALAGADAAQAEAMVALQSRLGRAAKAGWVLRTP